MKCLCLFFFKETPTSSNFTNITNINSNVIYARLKEGFLKRYIKVPQYYKLLLFTVIVIYKKKDYYFVLFWCQIFIYFYLK